MPLKRGVYCSVCTELRNREKKDCGTRVIRYLGMEKSGMKFILGSSFDRILSYSLLKVTSCFGEIVFQTLENSPFPPSQISIYIF